MEPPPAGSGACALALLALLLPSTLPAQHTRPPAAPKGTISVGATIHDSLARRDVLLTAESTYAQEWRLAGTTGQIVTIDLASEAFDAFVFLLGPGLEKPLQDDDSGDAFVFLLGPGLEKPLQDDDSGGRCNARLTVRLPRTGDYTIVVTSSEKFATGRFALAVAAGAKPKSLSPCPR